MMVSNAVMMIVTASASPESSSDFSLRLFLVMMKDNSRDSTSTSSQPPNPVYLKAVKPVEASGTLIPFSQFTSISSRVMTSSPAP